jgi:hypothetical protein
MHAPLRILSAQWCRISLRMNAVSELFSGPRRRAVLLAGLAALALAACATTAAPPPLVRLLPAGPSVIVYLARRKWHVDVGFAAADLQPALAPVGEHFAGVKYLFFGFGDRHYLLAGSRKNPSMLRALWPGPAVLLVTAVKDPAAAFGSSQVIELALRPAQARAVQAFIRASMADATPRPLGPGPYDDSAYYAAGPRYSALHTCNTWVAEALAAGDEPIHARGVILAGQLWSQALRLARSAVTQLQGG